MKILQSEVEKIIHRYSDALKRWDSIPIGDVMDIMVGECPISPIYAHCRSPQCPAKGFCGKRVVQPANHHWKSDAVKQSLEELLSGFLTWNYRLTQGKI